MFIGTVIISFFAFVWAAIGLLALDLPMQAAIVPGLISVGLVAWAWQRRHLVPLITVAQKQQIDRAVIWASSIEGIAIFAAVNILHRLHADTLIVPAVSVIVGLHFAQLAHMMPRRFYYLTALLMILVGGAGMWLPIIANQASIGLADAVILWGTGVYMLTQMTGRPQQGLGITVA